MPLKRVLWSVMGLCGSTSSSSSTWRGWGGGSWVVGLRAESSRPTMRPSNALPCCAPQAPLALVPGRREPTCPSRSTSVTLVSSKPASVMHISQSTATKSCGGVPAGRRAGGPDASAICAQSAATQGRVAHRRRDLGLCQPLAPARRRQARPSCTRPQAGCLPASPLQGWVATKPGRQTSFPLASSSLGSG